MDRQFKTLAHYTGYSVKITELNLNQGSTDNDITFC